MMELAMIVAMLVLLVYVVGSMPRKASGRELRRLHAEWQAEIDAWRAHRDVPGQPCPNPWLIGMRDPVLDRHRREFLAQYKDEHDEWRRKRWAAHAASRALTQPNLIDRLKRRRRGE